MKAKLNGVHGKLWWFKDPARVTHLEKVPLSERVEQTVLRKLQQRGKVTFTEVWDAVSSEFPNSLTSDSMSIKEALKAYAKPVAKGYWLIKSNFKPGAIEKEHTTMIALLAEIGKPLGYKIWVGKNEQSHEITALPNRSGALRQYVTFTNIKRLKNIQNPKIVKDIDLLWIKNEQVVAVFEIESTTSMTSGLQRSSNVGSNVPKFLVIPEERETQLIQKLKSPMFAERFGDDSWKVLYFGTLKEAYGKHKGKTKIEKLINKKVLKRIIKSKNTKNQLGLFEKEEP